MTVDATGLERAFRENALVKCGLVRDGFVNGAQSRCSRRSGKLAASIVGTEPVDAGTTIECTITVGEDYGLFQDQGTGIYGPEGQRIKGNPLLAFDWPAAGGLVIVHSVAGSPGTHFWTDTVSDWPNILRAVA